LLTAGKLGREMLDPVREPDQGKRLARPPFPFCLADARVQGRQLDILERPALGLSRQPRIFMNVDFPLPLAPMMVTNSPRAISTLAPRKACTRVSPSS
jgi:hypothetical protein